jgi:hypothetical protein
MRRQHFRCSCAGGKTNARVTRAESAQTVLIKTAQATPETDREPALGPSPTFDNVRLRAAISSTVDIKRALIRRCPDLGRVDRRVGNRRDDGRDTIRHRCGDRCASRGSSSRWEY